jgi:hypothetical protein
MGMIRIKEIESKTDLKKSHHIIKESFSTVADDFGLTPNNCPSKYVIWKKNWINITRGKKPGL